MPEKYTWYGARLTKKSGQTKPDMRTTEGKDGGCGCLLIIGFFVLGGIGWIIETLFN